MIIRTIILCSFVCNHDIYFICIFSLISIQYSFLDYYIYKCNSYCNCICLQLYIYCKSHCNQCHFYLVLLRHHLLVVVYIILFFYIPFHFSRKFTRKIVFFASFCIVYFKLNFHPPCIPILFYLSLLLLFIHCL